MNILIVTQYFWPEGFRINDLALALKNRGHVVTVLTGMPNYPTGRLFDGYRRGWWHHQRDNMDGVPIYRVPIFLRRQSRGWQLALNYLSFVIFGCLLAPWYFRKRSVDLIFVYEPSPFTVGIPAIVMRKLKRAPMLFWVQDLWPESLSATGAVKSSVALSLVAKMVRWIYRHCDKVLVQSEGFVDPAVAAGADQASIEYFPNWAERLYRPVEVPNDAQERHDVPQDGFVVMFAGNLGAAQSLETVLDAAELLKSQSIYWVFLGDGRRSDWMREQISVRQLHRVRMLGSRALATMPSYFALADAMLVTLRADPIMSATIPGKVQSYLACGRPIIGALNGEGAKVINESHAGYAVASGDVDGLVDAVKRMSRATNEERKLMGEAALACYRNTFNRNKLLDQLETMMLTMKSKK